MTVDKLLEDLGKQMGLGELKLDPKNRTTRLIFDRTLPINLEHNSHTRHLHVYAILGHFPPEEHEKLFTTMLHANWFGRGTGGATFAVDTAQEEIFLVRSFPEDQLEYHSFVKALQDFVDQFELWKDRLDAGQFDWIDEDGYKDLNEDDEDDSPGFNEEPVGIRI